MKMKKIVWMIGMATLLLLGTTGCGKGEGGGHASEELSLSILVGHHANATAPDVRQAYSSIKNAIATNGNLSIIAVDGAPFVFGKIDFEEDRKGLSQKKLEAVHKKYSEQIQSSLKDCFAKTPEVDTLSAIDLGARNLSGKKGEKQLVILDSGMQTTGYLNFTETYLESFNIPKILSDLKKEDAIPNLEGVEVYWYGLGNVAGPQKELMPKNRKALMELWRAILEEGGADVFFSEEVFVDLERKEGLPKVTPVEILVPSNQISRYSEEVVVFDEETLNFYPGKADLLTPVEEVRKALTPICEYLLKNPSERILIVGTTAGVPDSQRSYSLNLSNERSLAVRQLILAEGVSASQVETLGMGCYDPFHVPDLNPDGSLNEMAPKNRKVLIVPMKSELAKKLKQWNF